MSRIRVFSGCIEMTVVAYRLIVLTYLVSLYVLPLLSISPQILSIQGDDETIHVEFLVEKPSPAIPVRGVVFLAHGCQHQATDWFPRSSDCLNCLELPVERFIVKSLLKRGYVALAASSRDKDHKCWMRHDVESSTAVISHVYGTLGLQYHKTPLYMIGASSGGAFVGMLSHYLMLNDRGFQASGISPQIMNIMGHGLLNHVAFPPVAFVHMERDKHTKRNIRDEIVVLNAEKIPFKEFIISPQPLTDDFFSSRGAAMSVNDSAKLVVAYRTQGVIDADRMILEDPRESNDWRQVAISTLPDTFPILDSLKPDNSPVNELMNLAWAQHEIVPYHLDEIIDWFETLPNLSKEKVVQDVATVESSKSRAVSESAVASIGGKKPKKKKSRNSPM